MVGHAGQELDEIVDVDRLVLVQVVGRIALAPGGHQPFERHCRRGRRTRRRRRCDLRLRDLGAAGHRALGVVAAARPRRATRDSFVASSGSGPFVVRTGGPAERGVLK